MISVVLTHKLENSSGKTVKTTTGWAKIALESKDGEGRSVLQLAVRSGPLCCGEMTSLVLSWAGLTGASLSVGERIGKGGDSLTLLSFAATQGSVQAVELLLETGGADPTARVQGGMTALMCAAREGEVEVVKT